MQKVKLLKPGDRIEIVAPGYGGDIEELKKAAQHIESLGYKASYPDNIFGTDLFCSNNDEARARHMINALNDDEIKAIWTLRGGYGCSRIIEKISAVKRPKSPKLLIGFSDITVFHNFLNQEWQWPSLHAPVLWQIVHDKIDEASKDALTKILSGETSEITFKDLVPLNLAANRDKPIKGNICGGNLALVIASTGTSWEINPKNKILFLEEVGEKAYRIDRLLVQLRQSGLAGKAAAIMFGDFIEDNPEKIEEVLSRFALEIKTPVLRIAGIGHGKSNLPLPFGTDAKIEFNDGVSLIVEGFGS